MGFGTRNTDGTYCSSLQQFLDTFLSNTDYPYFPAEQSLSIKDDIVTAFDGENWPTMRGKPMVPIIEVCLGPYWLHHRLSAEVAAAVPKPSAESASLNQDFSAEWLSKWLIFTNVS